jgi:hypothetical protein
MNALPTTDDLRAMTAHVTSLRPTLGTPYSYLFGGELYTVATDGWALLALRRDDGCPRPDSLQPRGPEFSGVVEPVPTEGWQPIDTAALVAWANEAAPDPASCPHCNGTKTVRANKCENCDGTGVAYCVCPTCDDEHDTDCEECHGKPQTDVPCTRCDEPREVKGWFGVALVNRANVWRWLSWLAPDAPVEAIVTGPEKPIRFRGPDWFALVMPMRYVNDHSLNVGVFDGWVGVASQKDTP